MNNHDHILIEGAQENNLQNISIAIPKDKLVVITGVSGSGKSSLAFDTLYAEGYRRYVENLSSFARFFLQSMKKPKVKRLDNLSPAIAIDQRSGSQNPRSTVGTLTDIYEYVRHLYAQIGVPFCPTCNLEMHRQDMETVIEKVRKLEEGTQLAIVGTWQEDQRTLVEKINAIENLGFARVRIDGRIITITELKQELFRQQRERNRINEEETEDEQKKVEVVVDRMMLNAKHFDRERIIDSLQTAAKIGKGQAVVVIDGIDELHYNKYFMCPRCGYTLKRILPKYFSFNSPEGACEKCTGLGNIAQVNIDRVIPNKKLSLAEGAIMPWSRSGGRMNGENYYRQVLEGLAKRYNFSLKTPVEKLPEEKLNKVLFGSGEDEIEMKEKAHKHSIQFEGVVKYLENKYQKADSSFVRSEIERFMSIQTCPVCQGKRLKAQYLNIRVFGRTIDQLVRMEIGALIQVLEKYITQVDNGKAAQPDHVVKVVKALCGEIINRLKPLEEVGLTYLNLDRSCQTLSGGEFQRTRLATQLYSGLSGVVYVLDEPSIGLHSRDNLRLLTTLKHIKDRGNSVIVVEHDRDIILAADHVIDMGPGAGAEGGEVIFEGSVKQLKKAKTETSLYLAGKKRFSSRGDNKPVREKLVIRGASEHNLKHIDISIPLKKMVSVVGVSGSGKSSLINDILAKSLRMNIMGSFDQPGAHDRIDGIEKVQKVVIVDQSPIGRSPRSNAATYTGVFNHIRDLFAKTQLAKDRGYNASHFSFNIRGGRCEHCQGEGVRKIEMHLLDDVYAICPHCQGTRYSKKILDVEYHGATIAQVLEMNIDYAKNFFSFNKVIHDKLDALCKVGLGYLRLGQSATELSGGEAQRIKLATELARKAKGNTLYILDEPTIGLHFSDIARLLKVLQDLVDKGNSVIVVEHNLDVIKSSDWIIELGPEGGERGGKVVFEGPYEKIKTAKTWTGKAVSGKW